MPNSYVIISLLILSLLLESCSGCSRSGLREELASRSGNGNQRNSSRTEAIERSNEYVESQSDEYPSLTNLFKQKKSAVFVVYTKRDNVNIQGSGFFISDNGIGISNYHVFEGTYPSDGIIKLFNGSAYKIQEILDRNEENDYIIFKVQTNEKVNHLPVSLISPEIGENVFAIGNPQGLEHTLSTGIISGYRQDNDYIQTTTEITHGSSGGPLLNMKGEVVGITTSGFGEANLNFAINIQRLNLKRYLSLLNSQRHVAPKYFVNIKAQSNGDHEVHLEDCSFLPSVNNRKFLSEFTNCNEAVLAANEYFTEVNGCYYCSRDCHTQ